MLSLFLPVLLSLLGCEDEPVEYQNTEPIVSISSHSNGEEVYDGYMITLVGSATDAEDANNDLVATWYVGGKPICADTPAVDGTTECDVTIIDHDTSTEDGETTQIHLNDGMVMLYMKDSEEAAGFDTVTLVIIDISTPVVEISAPVEGGAYDSDQSIEFTGVVSDEDDDLGDLIVWWESSLGDDMTGVNSNPDADGEIAGNGYLSEGEHTIELFAQDLTGRVGSDSVTVNIGPPNSSPTCLLTAPADNSTNAAGVDGCL